jgi:hypothetical protein
MLGIDRSFIEKLSDVSLKHARDPYAYIQWPPEIPVDAWYTSPELISIYATPYWEQLDEPAQKRLSLLEAGNFYSLNIHGEKALIEGLAARLYDRNNLEVTKYLHHFLAEENKHSVLFGGFCTRYLGKIYPDRKLAIPRPMERMEADLLFFAKVLIFEELVDYYNLYMAHDGRLHPLARQINENHHYEESRHLAFGRRMLGQLYSDYAARLSTERQFELSRYLSTYLTATWHDYYQPDVYRDAGFAAPFEVVAAAWDHPVQREHRTTVSRKCISQLSRIGILLEAPEL